MRAFDVRTGALRWAWDPVTARLAARPQPGQGDARYTAGTPNVWSAILSGDPERGPRLRAHRQRVAGLLLRQPAWDSTTTRVRRWRSTPRRAEGALELPDRAQRHLGLRRRLPARAHRDPGGRRPAFRWWCRPRRWGWSSCCTATPASRSSTSRNDRCPRATCPGETVTPTQPFPTHIPPLHPHGPHPGRCLGLHSLGPRRLRGADRRACAPKASTRRSPSRARSSSRTPGGGPNWGSVAIDSQRRHVRQLVPHARDDQDC